VIVCAVGAVTVTVRRSGRCHGTSAIIPRVRFCLPVRRKRPIIAILAEDLRRTRNAAPAMLINRYERAGAHNTARADRARRDALALERQHARRCASEESQRIDRKKAHVCTG
jgi:hypothetical protein